MSLRPRPRATKSSMLNSNTGSPTSDLPQNHRRLTMCAEGKSASPSFTPIGRSPIAKSSRDGC